MDRFSGIAEFVAAVETGSFRGAGLRLGLTTSGISKAVSRLEQRLGIVLLNRTTRSLHLTGTGAEFFPEARRLLRQLDELEAGLTQSKDELRGRLRVEAPPAFGRLVVMPALPRFLLAYPEIELQLFLRDRLVDLAEEGIDAAIRVGELQQAPLVARRLGATRFVTCAAPAYLARAGVPRTPEELLQHNCLGYVPSHSTRPRGWRFARDGVPWSAPPTGSLALDSTEGLLEAALQGVGIIQVLDFVVAGPMRQGLLQPVLEEWSGAERPISLVHVASSRRTARVQAFSEFAVGLFPLSGSSEETHLAVPPEPGLS